MLPPEAPRSETPAGKEGAPPDLSDGISPDQARFDILLLEDETRIAGWLAAELTVWPGSRQVHVSPTIADATDALARQTFDILVADLGLPDGSGNQMIRLLKSQQPDAICIVMSALSDPAVVLEAIRAGADGYVEKADPTLDIVAAIGLAMQNKAALSPSIARHIIEALQTSSPAAKPVPPEGDLALTPREMEILLAMSKGYTHTEIAEILGISVQTVPVHTRNIYRKMQVKNKTEAVYYARQDGLIP